MAINWITPAGNLVTDYEESTLKDVFINVEPSDVTVEIISGQLPEGVSLYKVRDGRYGLEGVLPIVAEKTVFYFTLRAKTDSEHSDRYFAVTVDNKKTDWDSSQPNEFVFSETAYVSLQLQLTNATGEESFVKMTGELPNGLTINNTGLIYGIADEVPEELSYRFTVGVKKNNEIILTKDFQINIIKLSSLNEPIWITESGNLGSINYNRISDMFVKAYDPNNLPVIYKLVDEDSLPEGLSLNTANGRIEGQLKTEYVAEWAFKVIVSNGAYDVVREFSISTNTITEENDVSWVTQSALGKHRIGENVLIKLETKSNYPVYYTLLTNTLPKGLSFNSNGEIIGMIDYQDLGTHKFLVEVSNGYKTIQKEFSFEITKGLGKNSLKCYFYINHEYDNEYNDMVGTFDRATAYEPSNPIYKINPYPEIDVCNLTCFDKTLLKQMLYFNEPIDMVWGKTVRKNYLHNDEIIYSAFYKSLREQPSTGGNYVFKGNKIYVQPSKTSETGYINEYTGEPIVLTGELQKEKRDGERYIIYLNRKVYVDILNSNNYYEKESLQVVNTTSNPIYIEEYVFQEEILKREYIVRDNQKFEVLKAKDGDIANRDTNEYMGLNTSTTEILYDAPTIRYFFIDSTSTSIAYASTAEIRNVLEQPIYVEKNPNSVLYDMSTQEIISENSDYPEYMINWDERNKTYYAEYLGEKIYMDVYTLNPITSQPEVVYASWERADFDEDMDGGVASTDSVEDVVASGDASTETYREVIDANNDRYVIKPVKVYTEYLNTDVDYKEYLVYEQGTTNLQEGILFTLGWNNERKFIILNGRVHIVEKIDQPWVYKPSLNESIGHSNEIVLPFITDDDVKTSGKKSYIKFFDTDYESLPAWKSKDIEEWEEAHSYIVGDVFTYEGIYYIVTQNFVSTRTFDSSNLRKMSDLEIQEYKKTYYFPSLDLFYGRPNTNLLSLDTLNIKENKGGYWTDRKFVFFEVHFKPMYNNNIDNFSIDFYNHKNERTAEFQLI